MAIEYHLDLYPSDDPRDGSRLVRYSADTALQAADYRDVIGVGSGKAIIGADLADELDPAGEQYIRVVRDDGSTELVVGGFWTNSIRYEAAVKNETRRLELGGAGTMAYLARSVMAPHTYIHAVFTGQDPFDRIWRLWNQGDPAGGDFLGAVLWRVIYEAQHFRSGSYTHKHKDGVIYTDTHDNDRLRTAIPDLVMGFDQFEDSDGNDWTQPSGQFTAQVGENVLAVVRRLIESGLYIEMDPDTFELRAWEGNDHRRDRTGGAWGTNVVRLQAPTDGTIATGNIKSDSERLITSHIRRTTVWTGGGDDLYGIADTPGIRPWEGFVPSDAGDATVLDNLADTQLAARTEAGDVLTARLKLGQTPTQGMYLPFEHVKLDDLVTVHTGTGDWDYDEATYPVGALRIHLRDGGDWDAWVDLGASFEAMAQRQFEVAAAPAHTHPPNPELCRLPTTGSSWSQRLYFSENNASITPLVNDAAWGAGDETVKLLKTAPDGTYGSAQRDIFVAVGLGLGNYKDEVPSYAIQITDASMLAAIQAGGAAFLMQVRARSRTGVGIDDAAQFNYPQTVIRIRRTSGGGSWVGTALAAHSGTPGYRFAQGTNGQNRTWSGTLSAVAGAALNDWVVLEVGTRHVTPTSGGSGAYWFPNSTVGASDLPANDETSLDTTLNSWVEFAVTGVGATPGDVPLDTVHQDSEQIGTSVRAARCDHQHAHGLLAGDQYHNLSHVSNYIVHADAAPSVNDDEGDGYQAGTIWLDDSTGHIYMLVDASTGAAVWTAIAGTAISDLDDLGDVTITAPALDDELRYDGSEWINDPRKWEAVTDGEDVFVWESDDLVHEWNGAP